MPLFKQRLTISLARNLSAFLHLDAGLIRGPAPVEDFEQLYRQARGEIANRDGQIANRDGQIEQLSTELSSKTEDNIKLYTQVNELTRETKSRHEYKEVWTVSAQTKEQAATSVQGTADEQVLLDTGKGRREMLERTVGVGKDDVMLEIGCGVGRVGQALAPICKEWIGCDVSPKMIEYAKERLAEFDNVRFVEVSGYDLKEIPASSVDVVYSTVVFMHLEEWDRYNYVLEARRILRPGGRICIDNFNLRSKEGWSLFEKTRQLAPDERPPHIGKSSTPQELEVYLKRGEFKDVKTRESGLFTEAWAVK